MDIKVGRKAIADATEKLKNWGRWGKDDQMGAVNLITPAKRKQAVAEVKEGVSFSMARSAELEKAVDNNQPIISKMTRVGVGQPRGRKVNPWLVKRPISTAFFMPLAILRGE